MSEDGNGWYFTRKEIAENSPSKRDGIDWKKETYLRRSYCTFLQDLAMRLKVPQVTIATAIIFAIDSTFVIPLEGKIGGSLQQCACFLLGSSKNQTEGRV
ncbi:hypothetical protein K1719_010997 [Acacia pycnantha]|nr:hypothetical protein K1719_010997 [Acacia pycnantha]